MGNLRHIAISLPDPRKTAEIDRYAGAMAAMGATDSGPTGQTGLRR